MTEEERLPHYAKKALARLRDKRLTLIRTSSDTDEAVTKGGGFLYSTHPDGKRFPPASAKLLIDDGFLEPQGDGLLSEVSQTFRAPVHA
jgi:hypothetical protein